MSDEREHILRQIDRQRATFAAATGVDVPPPAITHGLVRVARAIAHGHFRGFLEALAA
jgi:hypothetical protein